MKYLMFTTILLVFSLGLAGQEATTEKPKRWYLTTHFGLDTKVYATGGGFKSSKLLFSELGYRLHRNFDIGVQLGLKRETLSGFSTLRSIDVETGLFMTSWNSRKRDYFLGIQGRLNFRVGQGDLSLSGTYGLVRHSNLTQARSPLPFFAYLRMAPLTHGYLNVHFAYTYWATPQFGLMIGYSVLSPMNRNITRNVEYIQGNMPRYTVEELTVEGAELSDSSLLKLRGFIDSGSWYYFTIGLTARLF